MQDVKTSSYEDEKIEYDLHSTDEQIVVEDNALHHQPPVEEYQFTWRASIVGSLLGCLVGNINYTYHFIVAYHAILNSRFKYLPRFENWLDIWCFTFRCHFFVRYFEAIISNSSTQVGWRILWT